MVKPLSISLPAVSKHLKARERAGLIESGRVAPLKDVSEWLELYRKNWEESFDRLDVYLQEIQKTQRRKKH
ncbi:MAG: hypothetical protein ACRDFQ_07135 [Anaerolineales bacterium]